MIKQKLMSCLINEYMIQKAISEITKDKTVIMIAHRLSTVKNVDKISDDAYKHLQKFFKHLDPEYEGIIPPDFDDTV